MRTYVETNKIIKPILENYYFNFQYLDGEQTKRFIGIPYGKTKPMIDVISIGIVNNGCRKYYAINKEFNLREAWNRFEWKEWNSVHEEKLFQKSYTIRETVLKAIWIELFKIHGKYTKISDAVFAWEEMKDREKYVYLKLLILKYGKTRKEIANYIKCIIGSKESVANWDEVKNKISFNFYGFDCKDYSKCLSSILNGIVELPIEYRNLPFADLKVVLDSYSNDVKLNYSSLQKFANKMEFYHSLHSAIHDRNLHDYLIRIDKQNK